MAKKAAQKAASNRIFVVRNATTGTAQYLSAESKAAVVQYLLGDYEISPAKRPDLMALVNGEAELETVE